jgi:hypothetical protein
MLLYNKRKMVEDMLHVRFDPLACLTHSLAEYVTTTSLKSDISPTTQLFEDLNSRGCCPRGVNKVGPRDNELNRRLSRNTGRGVAIVSIVIKCSDPSQIDASREIEIGVRSSLLSSHCTKSCSDLASQAPGCIHALL